MKKDYINEETYEKGISVLKNARIIAILIYIVVLAIGIFLLVSGLSMEEPSMGSKEWFENSSKKTGLTMFGTFVIIASTMFAIFFIIAISAKIHERSIASFNASQMMPIHKEYLEEMTPTIANMVDEIRPSNKDNLPNRDTVFCTYCGYENRRDARYCNHCGNKMD